MAHDSPKLANTPRQNPSSPSSWRPSCAKRLLSTKRSSRARCSSQSRQRPTERAAGLGHPDTGSPEALKAICCGPQLYQRRGAMHSGKREQVQGDELIIFEVARMFGTLPHVVAQLPFHYYQRLRSYYLASKGLSEGESDAPYTITNEEFDISEERFKGDYV